MLSISLGDPVNEDKNLSLRSRGPFWLKSYGSYPEFLPQDMWLTFLTGHEFAVGELIWSYVGDDLTRARAIATVHRAPMLYFCDLWWEISCDWESLLDYNYQVAEDRCIAADLEAHFQEHGTSGLPLHLGWRSDSDERQASPDEYDSD